MTQASHASNERNLNHSTTAPETNHANSSMPRVPTTSTQSRSARQQRRVRATEANALVDAENELLAQEQAGSGSSQRSDLPSDLEQGADSDDSMQSASSNSSHNTRSDSRLVNSIATVNLMMLTPNFFSMRSNPAARSMAADLPSNHSSTSSESESDDNESIPDIHSVSSASSGRSRRVRLEDIGGDGSSDDDDLGRYMDSDAGDSDSEAELEAEHADELEREIHAAGKSMHSSRYCSLTR